MWCLHAAICSCVVVNGLSLCLIVCMGVVYVTAGLVLWGLPLQHRCQQELGMTAFLRAAADS